MISFQSLKGSALLLFGFAPLISFSSDPIKSYLDGGTKVVADQREYVVIPANAPVLTKEEALEWWSKHSDGSTCTPSDLPKILPAVQIFGARVFQINDENEVVNEDDWLRNDPINKSSNEDKLDGHKNWEDEDFDTVE